MLGAGPLGGRGGSRRWWLLPLLLLYCPLATMPGRRGEAGGPRSRADAGALVPTCAPTTTTGWGRLRSSPPIASQLRPASYRRRSRGPGSVRRFPPGPLAAPTAAIWPKPPSGSAAPLPRERCCPGSGPERELRSPPEAASVKAPYLRPFLRHRASPLLREVSAPGPPLPGYKAGCAPVLRSCCFPAAGGSWPPPLPSLPAPLGGLGAWQPEFSALQASRCLLGG